MKSHPDFDFDWLLYLAIVIASLELNGEKLGWVVDSRSGRFLLLAVFASRPIDSLVLKIVPH